MVSQLNRERECDVTQHQPHPMLCRSSSPTYLRDAILAWYPSEVASILKQHWPPVTVATHLEKVVNVKSKPLLIAALSALGQTWDMSSSTENIIDGTGTGSDDDD